MSHWFNFHSVLIQFTMQITSISVVQTLSYQSTSHPALRTLWQYMFEIMLLWKIMNKVHESSVI